MPRRVCTCPETSPQSPPGEQRRVKRGASGILPLPHTHIPTACQVSILILCLTDAVYDAVPQSSGDHCRDPPRWHLKKKKGKRNIPSIFCTKIHVRASEQEREGDARWNVVLKDNEILRTCQNQASTVLELIQAELLIMTGDMDVFTMPVSPHCFPLTMIRYTTIIGLINSLIARNT